MNKKSGFTLIEILVVVSIIGILAAVVLASLGIARSKGKDGAVKSNLRGVMNQVEILFNTRTANQNTYVNACTNGTVDGVDGIGSIVLTAAKATGLASYGTNTTGTGTTATCNNTSTAYAVEVPLNGSTNGTPKMWCVDSMGHFRQAFTSIGATTLCP